jgi:hypothetical protein
MSESEIGIAHYQIRVKGRDARWSPDPGWVDSLRLLRLRVASIPYTLGGVRMPPWLLSYRSEERNDGKRVDLSSGAGGGPGTA